MGAMAAACPAAVLLPPLLLLAMLAGTSGQQAHSRRARSQPRQVLASGAADELHVVTVCTQEQARTAASCCQT